MWSNICGGCSEHLRVSHVYLHVCTGKSGGATDDKPATFVIRTKLVIKDLPQPCPGDSPVRVLNQELQQPELTGTTTGSYTACACNVWRHPPQTSEPVARQLVLVRTSWQRLAKPALTLAKPTIDEAHTDGQPASATDCRSTACTRWHYGSHNTYCGTHVTCTSILYFHWRCKKSHVVYFNC
jgi:hypothetical protein